MKNLLNLNICLSKIKNENNVKILINFIKKRKIKCYLFYYYR